MFIESASIRRLRADLCAKKAHRRVFTSHCPNMACSPCKNNFVVDKKTKRNREKRKDFVVRIFCDKKGRFIPQTIRLWYKTQKILRVDELREPHLFVVCLLVRLV